jgi:OOP family OmpA-OmpF porin
MKKTIQFLFLICILMPLVVTAQKTTTTTISKSSKPNVEINIEKKYQIKINGDDANSQNSNTKTTTTVKQNPNSSKPNNQDVENTTQPLLATSKYDFISGEKIIAVEDFSNTEIGDFPTRWNTNSSAEVVTLSNQEGKWLQIGQKGNFLQEFITKLPANFTYEFDLICTQPFKFYSSSLRLYFVNMLNPKIDYLKWQQFKSDKDGLYIEIHPSAINIDNKPKGRFSVESKVDKQSILKNKFEQDVFDQLNKPKVHVAVWRQNERLRVYLNEEKILDLPKAFIANNYNGILYSFEEFKPENYYYLSNFKFAVGAPDTRNKLISEGKFSTTGILFDVNSDVVKPASYGVLKEIADILNENKEVRIKIVGHTDNDGDATKNMELSKKRANAVKNYLIKNFAVNGSRIETDGKGATQPIDKANTKEAKANNRRVEFVKL